MTTLPQYDFTGKTIFITGGAAGIGQSTAQAFAKAKAKVMITDINADLGLGTLRQIREQGGVAEFIKCDVSKEADVKSAIEKTVKTFGGLDFAYNNAGIEGAPAPTADCTTENWEKTLAINLSGVWYCMKYQIPEILKRGGGSIVNCASIAGLVGISAMPAYTASKHAVVGLTKASALEYAKQNIRINAICPGAIHTPMLDRFTGGKAEALANMAANEPMGRVGRPEEIAAGVLWLCSEASSFVTGQSLAIDGGWITP